MSGHECVYSNPFFRVMKKGNYHHIEQAGDRRGAVILLKHNDRWVFVLNKRHTTGLTHLEAPRGGAAEGESAKACAIRECLEETGVTVKPEELTYLGQIMPDSGLLKTTVNIFYAESKDENVQEVLTPEEIDGVVRLTDDELAERVRSGEITCAMTLSAMAMRQQHENSKLHEGRKVEEVRLEEIGMGGHTAYQASIVTLGSKGELIADIIKTSTNKQEVEEQAKQLAQRFKVAVSEPKMALFDML